MSSIRPDLLRLVGGLLLFVSAVLLCSALVVDAYVINHLIMTISGASLPFSMTADQQFTLGSFHVCSSIQFSQTDTGQFLIATGTACPSIPSSCTTFLQLQDPLEPTQNLYPGAGIPLNLRRSCSTFLAGRAFLVQAAVLASFTSLVIIFMRCEPLERLFGRFGWSRKTVDRALLALAAWAALCAIIAIACQPDDVNEEWEGSICNEVQSSSNGNISNCEFQSAWGASYGCHVAAVVLCLLAIGLYAAGWYRDRGNPDFEVPLNAAAGGMRALGDSESLDFARAG